MATFAGDVTDLQQRHHPSNITSLDTTNFDSEADYPIGSRNVIESLSTTIFRHWPGYDRNMTGNVVTLI